MQCKLRDHPVQGVRRRYYKEHWHSGMPVGALVGEVTAAGLHCGPARWADLVLNRTWRECRPPACSAGCPTQRLPAAAAGVDVDAGMDTVGRPRGGRGGGGVGAGAYGGTKGKAKGGRMGQGLKGRASLETCCKGKVVLAKLLCHSNWKC